MRAGGVPAGGGAWRAVVFSRDGRYLYSGGDDNAIYRWDVGRVVSVGR